jgi:hypothetical protein
MTIASVEDTTNPNQYGRGTYRRQLAEMLVFSRVVATADYL